MSSWAEVSLAEVCGKPQYGAIAKGKNEPVGPLFVRQTDITSGRINFASVPYCDLDESEFEKYAIKTGDLLISRLGAGVGTAATVTETRDAVFAGYLVRFQPKVTVAVPGFVGYQLRSSGWWGHVNGFRSGAAQPTLNAQQMGAFRFALPSKPEQREIAEMLGALDDSIESNEKSIALLEELGAACLASRVRTDESSGLPMADAAQMGQFIAVLETGSRPRGGVREGTVGTISLGAQHVQSAGVLRSRDFKSVPLEFANAMKRGRLSDGDVLVYKDGGKPGNFIPHISAFGLGFPVASAVINEHVYRVRAASGISQGLLYWVLRSPWLDDEMRKRGTGVAIPGLNSSNFRELPFPLLTAEDKAYLNSSLDSMLFKMLQLGAENVRLESLRDALLPELLSGRLGRPQAEEALA